MEQQLNFNLTGNEARALMLALATSSANLPSQLIINLWTRLNEISQVQPPEFQAGGKVS